MYSYQQNFLFVPKITSPLNTENQLDTLTTKIGSILLNLPISGILDKEQKSSNIKGNYLMSSRIQKQLGYGLLDLKTKDGWKIDDPRINNDSILLDEDKMYDKYDTVENALADYKEYLKVNPARGGMDSAKTIDKFPTQLFDRLVTHRPEGGKKDVLIITPLSSLDAYKWYRSDDMIDYTEASLLKHPTKPIVKVFNNGFYPFIGNYIDKRTGESLKSFYIQSWIRALNSTGHPKKKEFSEKEINFLSDAAFDAGFDNYKDAVEFIIPAPQDDVASISRWGELFTDDKYLYDLKPILYTYWS